MRITGQATTAIGNAIVNFIVHMKFIQDNRYNINWMIVVGDDNLINCKRQPSNEGLNLDMKLKHNMKNKIIQ